MNTKINFAGIEMKNPVTVASGTFGYGREFSNFFNLSSNYEITPMYQSYGSSSGTIVAFREIVNVFVDVINIGNGKKVAALGNYINNDNLMIPYQIYGVK